VTRALGRALALCLVLVAIALGPAAHAEAWIPILPTAEELTPRQKASVKRSYRAASAAFARRHWTRALRFADKTFELLPNASTALIRATVLEKLDRHEEAFLAYLLAVDLGPSEQERALIAEGLGRVGASLDAGWLDVAATPEQATIFVEGVAFSDHRNVGLTGGEHEVVIEHEGYVTRRERVTITVGGRTSLSVALEKAPPPVVESLDDNASVADVTVPVLPPEEPSDAGWWVVGGGAAVLVAGIITHVAAVDAADEADGWAAPRPGVSSAAREVRYAEAVSRKDDLEAATWVCYSLGAAAVATGVVLILLEGEPEPGQATVTPVAVRGGGGLQLDVSF